LADKVISFYARGTTTCEIQGRLDEIYSVEVSLLLITSLADAALNEMKEWQEDRPLFGYLESIRNIIYAAAPSSR
jgi:transposase-like protein